MYEPDSIEAIGLNVEDAVSRGLEALNAKRDQVTIEVIDPGGRPAPGQRPREARVRLTLKPAPARPKAGSRASGETGARARSGTPDAHARAGNAGARP